MEEGSWGATSPRCRADLGLPLEPAGSSHRLHGVEQRSQPGSLWACARTPGRRRPVTDEECDECGFWETEEFIDPLSRR
jgi:hypothetical protein